MANAESAASGKPSKQRRVCVSHPRSREAKKAQKKRTDIEGPCGMRKIALCRMRSTCLLTRSTIAAVVSFFPAAGAVSSMAPSAFSAFAFSVSSSSEFSLSSVRAAMRIGMGCLFRPRRPSCGWERKRSRLLGVEEFLPHNTRQRGHNTVVAQKNFICVQKLTLFLECPKMGAEFFHRHHLAKQDIAHSRDTDKPLSTREYFVCFLSKWPSLRPWRRGIPEHQKDMENTELDYNRISTLNENKLYSHKSGFQIFFFRNVRQGP